MDEKTSISLTLAKAFLEQGHEDMARSIINKLLIDNGLDGEDEEMIHSP
jgi:Tfp pilus assembly protein FimV